ncbi:MAG: hypothetical protein ACYCW6_26475 [Candidatus Xenobia bacterium]
MPGLRTEITEIVTGLAMLGASEMQEALAERSARLVHVDTRHWEQLHEAAQDASYSADFARAWENGQSFLQATEGLRGRPPCRVEWKGGHPPVGYDPIPADLRIDHVYLVSCKYDSHILHNASPRNLFENLLAGKAREGDWYAQTAPAEYAALYEAARSLAEGLPESLDQLDAAGRKRLKDAFQNAAWTPQVRDAYAAFCAAVSRESARRWAAHLGTPQARELMLWRLLRLASAPYFLLGTARNRPLRLRIMTPWDWRQAFSLDALDIRADEAARQPLVRWRASVSGQAVDGHVEIRWSHGKFCGRPEAKVYLDTPHEAVPGYVPLT